MLSFHSSSYHISFLTSFSHLLHKLSKTPEKESPCQFFFRSALYRASFCNSIDFLWYYHFFLECIMKLPTIFFQKPGHKEQASSIIPFTNFSWRRPLLNDYAISPCIVFLTYWEERKLLQPNEKVLSLQLLISKFHLPQQSIHFF